MAHFEHRFDAPISAQPVGRHPHTAVHLPPDLVRRLPFGEPVHGAWQPGHPRDR